jgi:hypothetical protein
MVRNYTFLESLKMIVLPESFWHLDSGQLAAFKLPLFF